MKVNDVYAFRYNEAETSKRFEPYHCFDGQLIVRDKEGSLVLEDTYWGSGPNRQFTPEQAAEQGHLGLKCNLDEVERADAWEVEYYDPKDFFDLSSQHGCHPAYYKRKGAERSAEKMAAVLEAKIESMRQKIEWLKNDIVRAEESLRKVNEGDTSVYI